MDFLSSMNFWDYLILAIVCVAVFLAIFSMRSRKKKGKGCCNCGCQNCNNKKCK